ncbi:MAG: flagellar motor switch phosphatase FliY [Clostridiaceae bacterium]|nr:flagellar motor switch phosphatase FliY [Clostridiaceae bacterium]
MSDGFLSQEEIDLLLNGGGSALDDKKEDILSDVERDLLGEIGNISMGSASTALSTIVSQQVNITTPVVSLTTLAELKKEFEVPNIAVDVKYISGIDGQNLLIIKTSDAGIIANLMMGGDGKVENTNLSEIEISAVSEAMNQMIGSAATSMATMFGREVNISPPNCKVWDDKTTTLADDITEDENVVLVSFRLTVGDLIDSNLMQILPLTTARKIVSIMMGDDVVAPKAPEPKVDRPTQPKQVNQQQPQQQQYTQQDQYSQQNQYNQQDQYSQQDQYRQPEVQRPRVDVHQANFQPLQESAVHTSPRNIDLILDVPLEISVVLGRTKKSIKEILNLGTGSLIELEKLAEEPVEIMVNGKKVAYGEVVVVDENFGVRITSIVSSNERVKSLIQ